MALEEIPIPVDEISDEKSSDALIITTKKSPKFIEYYFQNFLQVIMRLQRL